MIAINGLGRIGRLAVRRFALTRPDRLCALNDTADLETVVHLLRFDSVHGDDHPRWPACAGTAGTTSACRAASTRCSTSPTRP